MNAGLRLRQDLRQRLELQLTPRQILQNEILMLPLNALRETLQQEVEENVFLEAGSEIQTVPGPEPRLTPARADDRSGADDAESLRSLVEAGAFHDYLKGNRGSGSGMGREIPEERNLEGFISRPASWRENLVDQLRMAPLDSEVRDAAILLVGYLDERGNLEEGLESIARETGVDPEALEEGLSALQSEAPPGVGARDLRERLLLQLRALPTRDPMAEQILEHCYEDLLRGRFARIGQRLNLDEDKILAALVTVRGLALENTDLDSDEEAVSVEPDARVERAPDGTWLVQVFDGGLPPIRISKETAALLGQAGTLDNETRQFLQAKLSRARWMREAVERRRSTLRKIVEEIVRRQERFFEEGPEGMVPLRQEEIAQAVDLHPSRVSRAIQDKYLETPYGMFPLKHFFPRGIEDEDGNNLARDNVQSVLQRIVDGEDPNNPLSDDALVERLREERVDISRRTVCKYRDELGIPPASARRGLYHKLRELNQGAHHRT